MNQERKADIDEQLSREAVNPYLQKSHFTTVGESGTDICMSHGGRDSDATSNSELPALEDDADAKGAQNLQVFERLAYQARVDREPLEHYWCCSSDILRGRSGGRPDDAGDWDWRKRVNGASDSDATTSDSELPELIDVEPENVDGRMAQLMQEKHCANLHAIIEHAADSNIRRIVRASGYLSTRCQVHDIELVLPHDMLREDTEMAGRYGVEIDEPIYLSSDAIKYRE